MYIDLTDREGPTALHLAASNGHLGTVLLVEHGANVNVRSERGWTLLHIMVFKGYLDVAGVVLKHITSGNSQDAQNLTAIHLAARERNVDVVRLLLEYNADVN
ncbi:ankyrin repeat-containing domain protein, partial [Vararia minispora EC-137]